MKSDTLLIPYASLFFHSFESNLFRQFVPTSSLQVSTSPSLHIAKSPRHQVALSPSRRSPTRQVAHSLPRSLAKSPSLQKAWLRLFSPTDQKSFVYTFRKNLTDFLYIFFRQRHFKNCSQCGQA